MRICCERNKQSGSECALLLGVEHLEGGASDPGSGRVEMARPGLKHRPVFPQRPGWAPSTGGEAEIHPGSKRGLVTVRSSSCVPTVCSRLTLLTPHGAPAGGTWKGAQVWNYWWRGLGLHSCNNTSRSQVESVGSPRFIYPTDESTPGLYGPSEGSSVVKECLPRAMAPSKGWNKKKLIFLSKLRQIYSGSWPGPLTQPLHLGRVESSHHLAEASLPLAKRQTSLLSFRIINDNTPC